MRQAGYSEATVRVECADGEIREVRPVKVCILVVKRPFVVCAGAGVHGKRG